MKILYDNKIRFSYIENIKSSIAIDCTRDRFGSASARKAVEELADQIEHVMSEEVEDNICRILGNPENCPHNNPIPKGDSDNDLGNEYSLPLVSCHSGESGEVSHIKTEDARKLRKIMNLGLIPGSRICLIQKFPNYVFQLGNTQLAVDKELANEIFIKLDE